jgi:hypothetical protein
MYGSKPICKQEELAEALSEAARAALPDNGMMELRLAELADRLGGGFPEYSIVARLAHRLLPREGIEPSIMTPVAEGDLVTLLEEVIAFCESKK